MPEKKFERLSDSERAVKKAAGLGDEVLLKTQKELYDGVGENYDPRQIFEGNVTMDEWSKIVNEEVGKRGLNKRKTSQ